MGWRYPLFVFRREKRSQRSKLEMLWCGTLPLIPRHGTKQRPVTRCWHYRRRFPANEQAANAARPPVRVQTLWPAAGVFRRLGRRVLAGVTFHQCLFGGVYRACLATAHWRDHHICAQEDRPKNVPDCGAGLWFPVSAFRVLLARRLAFAHFWFEPLALT